MLSSVEHENSFITSGPGLHGLPLSLLWNTGQKWLRFRLATYDEADVYLTSEILLLLQSALVSSKSKFSNTYISEQIKCMQNTFFDTKE